MGAEKYPTPRSCPATVEFCKSKPSKAANASKMTSPTMRRWHTRVGFGVSPPILLSVAESMLTVQNFADVGGFAP